VVRIHAISAVAVISILAVVAIPALQLREFGWELWLIGGTGLALCLLVVFVAGLVSRGIAQQLANVIAAQERLAANDFHFDLHEGDRSDAIGRLARGLLAIRDACAERERGIAEREQGLAETAAEAEASRKKDQEELRRKAELDQKYVAEYEQFMGSITKALERLSEGDLTCRLSPTLAKEYQKIGADFNGSVEKLQQAMRAVSTNTSTIRTGAQGISAAVDDLSRRSEQQAASLGQVAAALQEVGATVNKTVRGAGHAHDIASGARNDGERSSSVMQQAISTMSEIEKSSHEIGNITGVIDEIARQTNLLALNAAVEAARAGDAGRGFAVVASEVRALAQRSAEAAKKIKSLLTASESQIGQGVSLVAEAGTALGRICTQVVEIDAVVSEIASSAQQEAKGLREVNSTISEIDQVTQQNAAMAEQSTSASHNLAQETEELTKLVNRFQVGHDDGPRRHRPERASTAA